MPNPHGNPNIAHYGRNTRFGKPDACPQEVAQARAQHKHSIRHSLRVAAGRPIITLPDNYLESDEPVLTYEDIWSLFGYQRGDPLSAVQIMVCALLIKAVNGDLAAINLVERILDGPPDKVYVTFE
jgi:hypothetical protein